MLLVALNLSGVFEIGTSVQRRRLRRRGRAKGGLAGSAFFTGVLAVVVAAPCTAPFMAGAIGFALVQPPIVALAVFAALAIGFAAPFTLLAFAPGLLRAMPRPGPWMDTFRRLLAFPMYGAAAWLVWVFTLQAGDAGLAALLAAAVVAALAAWLFGRGQARSLAGTGSMPFTAAATAAALAAVGLLTVGLRASPSAADAKAAPAALASQAFTPERLAALRAEGKPVLVNFTAAWCVTCQVNDRLALSTAPVAEAFARTGVVYLKADWTNRDAVIAGVLAENGSAGVPLYLVYGASGGEAVKLPQLLTPGAVVAALEAAAKPAG